MIEPTGEANTQPRDLCEGDVTPDYVVLEPGAFAPNATDSVFATVMHRDGGRTVREWTEDMAARICVEVLANVEDGDHQSLQGTPWEKACTYVWGVS